MPGDQAMPQPWWRVRMMWLVVMGPATVVVASFVTLGLAIKYGDPPLKSETVATLHGDALKPAEDAPDHAEKPRH